MLAEDAWREQRQFLDFALDALGDHPLRDEVKREYEKLQPKMFDLKGSAMGSLFIHETAVCTSISFENNRPIN